MTEREDRIRRTAYLLWLEEGRPNGGAERHWLAAEAAIDSAPIELKRGEPPDQSPDARQPAPARNPDLANSKLAKLARPVQAKPKRVRRGHEPSPAK